MSEASLLSTLEMPCISNETTDEVRQLIATISNPKNVRCLAKTGKPRDEVRGQPERAHFCYSAALYSKVNK